jgi:hypothetical protein
MNMFEPNGPIWAFMGLHGPLWAHRPHWPILAQWATWAYMGHIKQITCHNSTRMRAPRLIIYWVKVMTHTRLVSLPTSLQGFINEVYVQLQTQNTFKNTLDCAYTTAIKGCVPLFHSRPKTTVA